MQSTAGIQIIIGTHSITSLLAASFNEKEKARILAEPLQMKVSILDNFIEGYINVFDENSLIEITTQIEKIDLISFDPTFNNISFKADIVCLFSNPLNDKFKSAKVNVAVRGSTTVELNDKLAFILKITLDQALVTALKPFFFSETTKKDFESQFKKKMLPQIL